MTNRSSVFIRIENYREVLDLADDLRQQLETIKGSYAELEELRKAEEDEMHRWRNNLVAIEDQLAEVDQTLFEPEE